MDISSFGITGVASITAICFLVAEIIKATKLNKKWIPPNLWYFRRCDGTNSNEDYSIFSCFGYAYRSGCRYCFWLIRYWYQSDI